MAAAEGLTSRIDGVADQVKELPSGVNAVRDSQAQMREILIDIQRRLRLPACLEVVPEGTAETAMGSDATVELSAAGGAADLLADDVGAVDPFTANFAVRSSTSMWRFG